MSSALLVTAMDQGMHFEPTPATRLVTDLPGRISTASLRDWIRRARLLVFTIVGAALLDLCVPSAAATMGIRETSAYGVLPFLLVATFAAGRLGLFWGHAIRARR